MNRNVWKLPLRALSILPSLAVLALLGAIGYFGHDRGWQWDKEKPKDEKKADANKDDGDDAAKVPSETDGNYGTSPFDSTLTIVHDPSTCGLNGMDLKFASIEAIHKSGVHTGKVVKRSLDEILTVTGTVEFDPTRIARISPRAGGILWRMHKQVGDVVKPSELLAIVDSGDVGKAKAAFYHAKVQLDLKQILRDRLQPGVSPERSIIEADSALREARVQMQTTYQSLLNLGFIFKLADIDKDNDAELARRLQFLGLPKDFGDAMPNEITSNLLPVRSPLIQAGVVLQRDGVTGEAVQAQQPIFVVGDTSRMMLTLDIRQEDRPRVKIGQKVRFQPDGDEGKPVEGVIDWIGNEFDPKTRTVKARAFVANPDERLKARAFGKARIEIRSASLVLTLPEEAIQWEGCSHIVFLHESPKKFEVRKVKLGIRRDGFVEVEPGFDESLFVDPLGFISKDGNVTFAFGVQENDVVAILGTHVLKSMLFRDRLGTADE